MSAVLGQPTPRIDGPAKVTGSARYTADVPVKNLAHAVSIQSSIANGRISTIDTSAANRQPGVLAVLTHLNAPRLPFRYPDPKPSVDPEVGEPLRALKDDRIHHNGQQIALVVAETLEQARHAATLIAVQYAEETAVTEFDAAARNAIAPSKQEADEPDELPSDVSRGDAEQAYAAAAVTVDATTLMASEHNNPIELHATIAQWEKTDGRDTLTLHEKTQSVGKTRDVIACVWGLPKENVRVLSPFVGGAFGSGLRCWPHVELAAMAAHVVRRPVKLMLSRAQMFSSVGYRPQTLQRVRIGAHRDGTITAILHEATAQTSMYEEYTEDTLSVTPMLYAAPNVATHYRIARMHVNTPTWMRAPGEATGVHALESAMDELAYALMMDPVELRLKNYAQTDPQENKPYSSKSLRACYLQGAERFGWRERHPRPRAMRDGRLLVGYGMATATYPANRSPASARACLSADGKLRVGSAASDMGPGTYTTMAMIAADALGVALEQVDFQLGDTRLPPAPVHGGSITTASVGSAVHEAAQALRAKLLLLACDDTQSPLCKSSADEVIAANGRFVLKSDPGRGETYTDILRRHGLPMLEASASSTPGDDDKKYAMHSFGAHFAEVRVDPELGMVRVQRMLGTFAAGRIVNPRTATSQALGGMVMGIGMALLERSELDARYGRWVTQDFSEYLVPVNTDALRLDALFVDEYDPHLSPIGVKGLAEVSTVGAAAAIGNAVFHATGRRMTQFPISIEQVLGL
jgi:xanthine dehydrogenase YagR molybdenum-binding subunit